MERKRSIQRSDSSIPGPLKEGEGRGSPLTQDRDQGPPSSIGVWPMQESRTAEIARSHHDTNPHFSPLSPPSQLINPLVMARFAILRGSMADSGVPRGLSSDVCRETRPPPPARPARPCGLPHTPLLALPSPLDPTSSTSCNVSCALCSCQRDLAIWEQDRPGRRECRVLLSPPSSFTNGLCIGMGGSRCSNGTLHPDAMGAVHHSSPRVHARTRTRQCPAMALDRREQAPRLPDASHGARAAACGHDESRLGLARPSRETVR